MPTYSGAKLPIAVVKGNGNFLYDTDGNRYLDLFSGLGVNVLGHSHPKIVQTLKEQGERFLHISNIYLNLPAIQLAKRLSDLTLGGKVFFTNSGAEATEAAVKLLHKYHKKVRPDRRGIVVMKKGFHGRTLGALKLTRQPGVYQDFPLPDYEIIEIEPEDVGALDKAIEQKPLAIMAEPVLGSGGVIPLSDDYLQTVTDRARAADVLVVIDEIQTGMGRTGTLFAYQSAGIDPDIVLFAKGVGGGLPLGGIIAKPEWSDLFGPGDHGTTFAPSPLAAALGNTVLDVLLDDGLLESANEAMTYMWKQLLLLKQDIKVVKDVRGRGFMIGIVTDASAEAVDFVRKNMVKAGFLIDVTQKTIIRLLPPLTLTKEDIDAFIIAFRQALTNLKD
ncbi:aspartate aminotransferase family protein [Camelliibacillus cellulosilyticus]|uniref:Aspartate aminotransferase family protein n=1 Tax=Camelliibacillus cellulosilyticus TaxID=2174486 RepID=A0ABV9GJ91_9BACL